MSIMEAFASLRSKYPEGGLNINPNFWSHSPGQFFIQWSVYIVETRQFFESPTLTGVVELALHPGGNPELSAVQVEQSVKEMASV